jgi:hypothetical protein
MPSATYALFRDAILGAQQIVCVYDGRRRELCPHIIGTSRSGEEVVLAWQFAGESSGSLPQWRCLKLANVSEAHAREGRWHEAARIARRRPASARSISTSTSMCASEGKEAQRAFEHNHRASRAYRERILAPHAAASPSK